MRADRIPLFPLNVVLLPRRRPSPAHFRAALPQDGPRMSRQQNRIRHAARACRGVAGTGCTAEILERVKTYDDGRMDILAVGREPFRVVELFTEDPLLEGSVGLFDDRLRHQTCRNAKNLSWKSTEACITADFWRLSAKRHSAKKSKSSFSYTIASKLPMDFAMEAASFGVAHRS